MKNLYVTLSLFVFLLVFGAFVFSPKSKAQNNVLYELLNLPAPPPPNPNFVGLSGNNTSRSPEFFDQEKPPADDAPIEDLLAYWERQNSLDSVYNQTIEPSNKVLSRILGEIEKNPEIIGNYLNVLTKTPSSADFVKGMYERSLSNDSPENYQSEQLKRWLTYNTNYFVDDLSQNAGQVKDANDYITNQDDLLALAKVDWERALPMLNRMLNDPNQPISQTLANWAFYLHELKEGNSIEADRYREALMKTVEDKSAKPGNRDLALDALVYGGDFQGRDDWYFSLLSDESLFDLRVGGRSYTGLTTLLMRSPPEKYVDKMIQLVKTGNQTVRNAAARNLLTVIRDNDPKIVEALLPWLENPNWANDLNGARRALAGVLAQIEMPESVPGLIAMLDEKGVQRTGSPNSMSSNTMVMNSNKMIESDSEFDAEGTYPYRSDAVAALAKQKSLQAVPALRRILPEVESWQRDTVVRAILESGGFSIAEQIDALESVAESVKDQINENDDKMSGNFAISTAKGDMALSREDVAAEDSAMVMPSVRVTAVANTMAYKDNKPPDKEVFNPADIIPLLGMQVAQISEPSSELVSAVVSRINRLENTNPAVANALRKIIENWNGPAINALMLTDLGNGKADSDVIVKLLSLRKELRGNQSNDIFAARNNANPVALGITACILENESEYAQILAGDNAEVKIALLSCGRLIRAKFPVQTVGALLKNPNNVLAKASELYLESEDSPQARNLIYALYPNKAKILGATAFFAPDNTKLGNQDFLSALFMSVNENYALPSYMIFSVLSEQGTMQAAERKLQQEITENADILGIYAYNENFVRIYADRAVFSWSENAARYRERTLTSQEFDYLKSYLARNNVGELPPFIGNCGGCEGRELLMLGAGGGRRIFVKSEKMPDFFAGLDKIFEEMRKPPAKLKYHLEKDIAGLEILYADDKFPVLTVWKNGAEMRMLIADKERRGQIDEELRLADVAAYENASEDSDYEKLETDSQKRRMMRLYDEFSWRNLKDGQPGDYVGQPPGFEIIPRKDNLAVQSNGEKWKSRAGNVEIRTNGEGIYRIKGNQTVKLQEGFYHSPIITPDGRWAVAAKLVDNSDNQLLVRINVQTGKETLIKVGENINFVRPIIFLSSQNKVLIAVGGHYDDEKERMTDGIFQLLDVETGTMQPVKGEVRPFVQQTFRPLQTNGKPDEFWAAIPAEGKEATEVGVYNTKNLTFTPLLKIPRIVFDSMDLWVDEPGNKIYFVHQGQLLALPLKKSE